MLPEMKVELKTGEKETVAWEGMFVGNFFKLS